jgi:hypothetical protein
MKNKILINSLNQFNSNLKVSLKAYLNSGCLETGNGSGIIDGIKFYQDYTVNWDNGYLEADSNEGYTLEDIIEVFSKKNISKIGSNDFKLRPGILKYGNATYKTTWENDNLKKEDIPKDLELYNIMDIDENEYKWISPSKIEIEIFYYNQNNEECKISFSLL